MLYHVAGNLSTLNWTGLESKPRQAKLWSLNSQMAEFSRKGAKTTQKKSNLSFRWLD